MAKTFLPPGFRFHPTDVELVVYYLKRKITGKPFRFQAVTEVELYKYAPWDLPEKSCLKSKDQEWFFFCARDRKYANGSRLNRATDVGYWKTTGKDRNILHNSRTVGTKKTLVFHTGKAPRGDRTDWVMHEYRLMDAELGNTGVQQDVYVLCKIFHKSGPGPKNGEHHGAPFNEQDWEVEMDNQEDAPIPFVSSPGPMDDATAAPVLPKYVPSEVGEASSSLAPPDNSDDDLFDQLLQVLDDLPYPSENANGEALGFEHDGAEFDFGDDQRRVNCFEGLSGLAEQVLTNSNVAATLNEDPALESLTSELATDNYMELNDIWFMLDINDPSDLSVLNFPTINGHFAESPHFSSMNLCCSVSPFDRDICYPTTNNSLPQGAGLNDGPPASTSEVGDFASVTDLLYDPNVQFGNVQLQAWESAPIDPNYSYDSVFPSSRFGSTFG